LTRLKKINLSETELIRALELRQQVGAEALYDMYSSALYGIIYRIVQHDGVAEDLLQETFVKIWNSFTQYSAERGRLFTWMSNIARNLAIDKVRSKEYRNNAQNQDIEKNVGVIDERQNSVMNPELLGVKNLLHKLKPEQKSIIDLVYFEGYTHVEASERLEIPLGTLKTRLRAALLELRRYF
jgi:RNA polymerase sigma factor (sigma-70 family)